MNEDDEFLPEFNGDAPSFEGPAFRPHVSLRRILAMVLVLAGLVVAAEYGYRFYDQNMSPEVRPPGIELPGIVVSGSSIDFSVAPPDTFHAFHISVSSDNATDADADAARIGLIGILTVQEETGARQRWEAPIQLLATDDRIISRTSIEDALLAKTQNSLVGLGVRHRIDYAIEPDPLSYDKISDRTDDRKDDRDHHPGEHLVDVAFDGYDEEPCDDIERRNGYYHCQKDAVHIR